MQPYSKGQRGDIQHDEHMVPCTLLEVTLSTEPGAVLKHCRGLTSNQNSNSVGLAFASLTDI